MICAECRVNRDVVADQLKDPHPYERSIAWCIIESCKACRYEFFDQYHDETDAILEGVKV